jgi:hypothetical protein
MILIMMNWAISAAPVIFDGLIEPVIDDPSISR